MSDEPPPEVDDEDDFDPVADEPIEVWFGPASLVPFWGLLVAFAWWLLQK